MRISERLLQNAPCFSFEFFPPKDDAGLAALYGTIADLSSLRPGFVSVTYGAGGSTRARTVEMVGHIKHDLGIEAMAHLTCYGHSRADLRILLDGLAQKGVENVLAMRGDPPKGQAYVLSPDGFSYANELITFIREQGFKFCIGGACYPETHPAAGSAEDDLVNLKRKVDAGVDFLITQLFFDNSRYFNFVERARKIGISVPIIPGIMPVTNAEQLDRFKKMCGVAIPDSLREKLQRCDGKPGAAMDIGVGYAIEQCQELIDHGIRHFHFYTLNKSPATRMIVGGLKWD